MHIAWTEAAILLGVLLIIGYTVYLTKSGKPLWALIIPLAMFIRLLNQSVPCG